MIIQRSVTDYDNPISGEHIVMVFKFRKFLLYDVKLLRMVHVTNFKSHCPIRMEQPGFPSKGTVVQKIRNLTKRSKFFQKSPKQETQPLASNTGKH